MNPPNPEQQTVRRGRGRPRKYPRVEKEETNSKDHAPPPPSAPKKNLSFPGLVSNQEEEHGNGNMFYKIIHSYIIRNRRLAIPKNFLKKFSRDLSDLAILKAPRGPTFRVELKKGHRGDVWFRNGWQDFVNYHSISPTDFLLFRYDGNSQFYVLIFDVSGTEIDYLPSTNGTTPFMTVKKETIDEEEYMKNMAYVSPVINESSVKPKSNTINPVFAYVSPVINESSVKPKSNTINPVSKNKDEPKNIDASALMQAASQFKSEHPFYTIQMKPSYVNHKFLPVLSTFDKRCMPGDRGCIKIQGSDGQEWFVGVLASENKKEYRLSKGISSFLADNNLKEGDVCVFELITENEGDIMLKAHIFQ